MAVPKNIQQIHCRSIIVALTSVHVHVCNQDLQTSLDLWPPFAVLGTL